MAGLEKEKAEISARYEKERAAIEANINSAGTLLTEKKRADAEDAIALSRRNEAAEIAKKELEFQEKKAQLAEREKQQMEQIAAKMEQRRAKELAEISEVEKLRDSLALQAKVGLDKEIEAINQRYDLELQRIQELADAKRISQGDSEALSSQVEIGRQNDLASARINNAKAVTAAEKAESERRLEIKNSEMSSTASLLGSAADAAKMFGAQGFAVFKAFSIGQAVIAGALATVRALAEVPYPANILAAAAAAAAAAIQIATISAAQPAGFQKGGYTGDGAENEPAGTVHRGEVVIPAKQVRRFGRGFTEGLANGVLDVGSLYNRFDYSPMPITSSNSSSAQAVRKGMSGGGSGGGSKVNVEGHKMSVAFVNSRAEMREFLKTSEGEKIVADIARKRRIEIGVNT